MITGDRVSQSRCLTSKTDSVLNNEGRCSKCGEETLDRFSEVEPTEKAGGDTHEAKKPNPLPIRKKRHWRRTIGLTILAVVVVGAAIFGFMVYNVMNRTSQEMAEHAGNYVNPAGSYILLLEDGDYRLGGYTPEFLAGEHWFVEGDDRIFVPTVREANGDILGNHYLIKGDSIVQARKVGENYVPDSDPNSVWTKRAKSSAPVTPSSTPP